MVYVRFLTACRQLRYAARLDTKVDYDLDASLSALSYEIDMIAPKNVADAADALANRARSYLRRSRDLKSLGLDAMSQTDEGDLMAKRVEVRHLVDAFIEEARKDLAA